MISFLRCCRAFPLILQGDTPPTAKGDLTATPTNKTIVLSWKRASDNKTLPGNLRYQVRWKRTSDKSWKYSHSEDKMPKDMTSYTIEDLTPKTKYDVDVKVCDGAGNASYYGKKSSADIFHGKFLSFFGGFGAETACWRAMQPTASRPCGFARRRADWADSV